MKGSDPFRRDARLCEGSAGAVALRSEDSASRLTDLIYLIGSRGCGKSTIGPQLAHRLGWAFLDADAVLEQKAGRTIAELFATEGGSAFREREAAILRDLSTLRQHVIATGGGIVLSDENRRLLRTTGFRVWLTAEPLTLHQRLQADPTTGSRRPALTSLPAAAEIERLLRERDPLYREVANHIVTTEGQSPEAVVSAILSAWATSSSTSP